MTADERGRGDVVGGGVGDQRGDCDVLGDSELVDDAAADVGAELADLLDDPRVAQEAGAGAARDPGPGGGGGDGRPGDVSGGEPVDGRAGPVLAQSGSRRVILRQREPVGEQCAAARTRVSSPASGLAATSR